MPLVLAGPILRRCDPQRVAFWLVTSEPCDCRLHLAIGQGELAAVAAPELEQLSLPVGRHCFVHWIYWSPGEPLAQRVEVRYDFSLETAAGAVWLTEQVPDINYDGAGHPSFVIDLAVSEVIHGSCRKPHHRCDDALVQLDRRLATRLAGAQARPNFLMMSGDQVYTDDVAGPMLWAIHQVIEMLGLFDESWSGALVNNSAELFAHPDNFYRRDALLPDEDANAAVSKRFWRGKRKPIFTTVNGGNHLVTFAEVMAMYLLVWSPALWQRVNLGKKDLQPAVQATYEKEKGIIERFVAGLPQVRRVLAHLPTYMIFDDHDVTDDWNLTRGWEEASYSHPFSKRIIGNALLGYLLCQGWGNDPEAFVPLHDELQTCFGDAGLKGQDQLIERLLAWSNWHYRLPTTPPTMVLDTRTQRWRSESNPAKPSGLMDWESLCDLQQHLIGQRSVIMVSATPVYGVKLIEVIQKIFTFFGKALTVDAENWMAHKGTASVMLNIFRHQSTPPLFIILSGDVHYSFVYDVTLRFSRQSPRICQITASGIKNEFPRTLLLWLDKLNRWLYHRRSPLNWFTQRRYMSIRPRKPPGGKGRTLLNTSGLGVLQLDGECKTIRTLVLTASGDELEFVQHRSPKLSPAPVVVERTSD
ncbi:alkaline phosphatase family protein [Exilibacterium tricleocarpae]|uniref:Alkaline phosphatase family protein n=1 Tax=Exilibacterium tricleocarpae TaxID=2591008 RepID=A0A545U8H1_9GAMM|nr:alkaline phosphatase family protein [Exilibacterium tricleocarpae]